MINDKLIKQLVENIAEECENWMQNVEVIGNQCAATDRQLETILDLANSLQKEYNKI